MSTAVASLLRRIMETAKCRRDPGQSNEKENRASPEAVVSRLRITTSASHLLGTYTLGAAIRGGPGEMVV